MSQLVAALIFVTLFTTGLAQGPNVCYASPTDFENACTQTFNGTVDGGRCFFIAGNGMNWTTGWDACRRRNSQMAQLHTEKEYQKVVEYAKARLGVDLMSYLMIALRDDYSPSAPSGSCQTDPQNTTWFDTETTGNSQLKIANTWMRYHACDDKVPSDEKPRCYVMYKANSGYPIGDAPCHVPSTQADTSSFRCYNKCYNVLCQYTNVAQTFNQSGACLTEVPIETIAATNPFDCAQFCGSRGWCRSYNYITGTEGSSNTCQLFTWSIYDNCPNCASRSAANATCSHYNYVP